ncbi:MAG: NAD-dependent epimerase/dehydratase family protein [Thermodesulfobacteriota bacterium]
MRRDNLKRALVTGGAGFIGSHIAASLLEKGLKVVVMDDLSMGRAENVPDGVSLVVGDICDDARLAAALDGVDVVFHNAARVSIRNSFDDVGEDTRTNVLGTVGLLRQAGRAGVKRFIYASSMAVYAPDSSIPINEGAALNPISPYGAGKLAGELYTKHLAAFFGFEHVVLRYFNTYGPGQTPTPYVGVITIFTRNLLAGRPPVIFGEGRQVRDFVHVSDVAEANLRAMEMAPDGAVINVGTGKGTSVGEIARILTERISPGMSPEYGPLPRGEPIDSVADTGELTRLLGFAPKAALDERIDGVIEWCAPPAQPARKKRKDARTLLGRPD